MMMQIMTSCRFHEGQRQYQYKSKHTPSRYQKIENAIKSDNTEEFSSQTVATLPTIIKITMVVTSLITTTNKTRWIMLIG